MSAIEFPTTTARPRGRVPSALELDFRPVQGARPAGWLLLFAGLFAALFATARHESAQAARSASLAAWNEASVHQGTVRQENGRPGPPLDPRASKAAFQIARELQTPWSQLLAALESTPARDVALLGVEPSAERHVIRITAEARNPPAMLEFLRNLQANREFSDVWLNAHAVQAQTPGAPVRFVVQLAWSRP